MSAGGLLTIVGLLGLIWVQDAHAKADGSPAFSRPERLAAAEPQASLRSAPAAEEPAMRARSMRLEMQSEQAFPGRLVGCLAPALRAVGMDWSAALVRGYTGSAFSISMKEDGEGLEQADSFEWSYFYEMLDYLNCEVINVSLSGNGYAVSPEEHTRAKAKAWDMVRRGIDDGYPAIGWWMIDKSAEKPLHAGLWSLIVGYDNETKTYSAHHAGAGEFTIGWDAFGHGDPINWFYIMVFRPTAEPFDAVAAHRRAIERAIEGSEGKYPGVPTGGGHEKTYPHAAAAAHGMAAWEMWIKALEAERSSAQDISRHVRFLVPLRAAAAAYLTEIEPELPAQVHQPLREAAEWYDEVVDRLKDLGDLSEQGQFDQQEAARLVSKAYEAEQAAVGKLREVLTVM